MNHTKNHTRKLSVLLFAFLFLVAINISSCERSAQIKIINQSNYEITIYYTFKFPDGTYGEPAYQEIVPADSTKIQSIILIKDEGVKRIEAKDPSGKIVFSHNYNRADLEKIGWKIVIPP